jgi:DNA-binding MarR family transcriptional regulator
VSDSESELYCTTLEVRILTAIVAKEARQDIEQRLKGYGVPITALQYRVLRQLEQRRSTIKALSQALMVEPATLVPVIGTLARHDFVRRGSDPRDRRRVPLELTQGGQEHLSRIPFVQEDDVIATYLRQLPAHERSAFLDHLRGLVTTIHGHDQAVRRITEAVANHFAFGEQQ